MNLEEFYNANPERRSSPECDYGVHWTEKGRRWPTYRVSYVQKTGEVYISGNSDATVEVLGIVPPDAENEPRHYYDTLDRILEGWADECSKPDSLAWVRERLAAAGVAA